jgi:hypothetical protein
MRGRDGFVEVRPGHKVPVELANDFILDFEEALAKYECQPPLAKDALIKDGERVWAAVQKGRAPLIEWEPIVTRTVVDGDGNEVDARVRRRQAHPAGQAAARAPSCSCTATPPHVNDASARLAHGVPATIMLHVPAGEVLTASRCAAQRGSPDELVPWERDVTKTSSDRRRADRLAPDPKPQPPRRPAQRQGRHAAARRALRPQRWGGITFDQYDSAETVQWLQTKKLPSRTRQWSNPFQHRIYRGARSAFYNDLVTLPDTPTITSRGPARARRDLRAAARRGDRGPQDRPPRGRQQGPRRRRRARHRARDRPGPSRRRSPSRRCG